MSADVTEPLPGVRITGAMLPHFAEILTPEAIAFVVALQRTFNGRRKELLERRLRRQEFRIVQQKFTFAVRPLVAALRCERAPVQFQIQLTVPGR